MIFCAEPHAATELGADCRDAALLFDELLGLLGRRGRGAFAPQRGADIGDDHLRPGAGHHDRDLAPDAAARAGHHGDLAFHHACHVCPP